MSDEETTVAALRSSAIDMSRCTPELLGAWSKAQCAVRTVAKDGRNTSTGAGYAYATGDGMVAEGRACRDGTGLCLFSTWSSEDVDDDGKGNQWVCAIVTVHWVMGHESGGYVSGTITGHAIGSKGRPPDKAVAAAATYIEGFLDRGLMRLSRGGESDDDVDRRTEGDFERARRQPARPASPASAFADDAKGTPAHDPQAKLREVHAKVRRTFERGKWTEDAGNRAFAMIEKLGGSEETLRGWLRKLRADRDDAVEIPDTDPLDIDEVPPLDASDFRHGSADEERAASEDAAMNRATEPKCLAAMAAAGNSADLVVTVLEYARQLRELDPPVMRAALLEHGERVGADVATLDTALHDGCRIGGES